MSRAPICLAIVFPSDVVLYELVCWMTYENMIFFVKVSGSATTVGATQSLKSESNPTVCISNIYYLCYHYSRPNKSRRTRITSTANIATATSSIATAVASVIK